MTHATAWAPLAVAALTGCAHEGEYDNVERSARAEHDEHVRRGQSERWAPERAAPQVGREAPPSQWSDEDDTLQHFLMQPWEVDVRRRAAVELKCPESKLTVTVLDTANLGNDMLVQVDGCDQSQTYMVQTVIRTRH